MRILPMRENARRIPQAALWFAQKWEIEAAAYAKSMRECVQKQTGVPQWYVVLQNDTILAGAGVIANDFHDRKDLTPMCALCLWKMGTAAGALPKSCWPLLPGIWQKWE